MKVGIKLGKVKNFGIGSCVLHRVAADNAGKKAGRNIFCKFHHFEEIADMISFRKIYLRYMHFKLRFTNINEKAGYRSFRGFHGFLGSSRGVLC